MVFMFFMECQKPNATEKSQRKNKNLIISFSVNWTFQPKLNDNVTSAPLHLFRVIE